MKVKSLDYAIGSTLECAACLDLAEIKRLLEISEVCSGKSELLKILRMLQFRRLDTLATSMVLNIAEGNGRFSVPDQNRFLGTSHEAAIKLAARLDQCVAQAFMSGQEAGGVKELLSRVAAMTSAMIGRDR